MMILFQNLGGWLERAFPGGTGLMLALLVMTGALIWNTALNYSKFKSMGDAIADIKVTMVTKEGLALQLANLKGELSEAAGNRFQSRRDADRMQGEFDAIWRNIEALRTGKADRA